jgi:hypothetical protein
MHPTFRFLLAKQNWKKDNLTDDRETGTNLQPVWILNNPDGDTHVRIKGCRFDSACPVWMHTQSNITNIIFTWVHNTNTHKIKLTILIWNVWSKEVCDFQPGFITKCTVKFCKGLFFVKAYTIQLVVYDSYPGVCTWTNVCRDVTFQVLP